MPEPKLWRYQFLEWPEGVASLFDQGGMRRFLMTSSLRSVACKSGYRAGLVYDSVRSDV
jgi:hypothetical protein